VKPLGGSEEEITGIFMPLNNPADVPDSYNFIKPGVEDLGDFRSARLLYNASRLSFRQVAGPFRCLGKISFRPRSYQLVPLIMALRQKQVRLLIGDDVGVGKTIEALLIARELYERKEISRFAILCLPHLCDQWQEELKSKFGVEAVIIRSGSVTALERQIRSNENIFRAFPFQIISIDYIKGGDKRQKFIDHAPELIMVDEAHSCARPSGANDSQQLRFKLLRDLVDQKDPHLVLITATPHSGKTNEFQSLLGLLDKKFESLDIASADKKQREELSRHFIQRRRGDVLQWMKNDVQFPVRQTYDFPYPVDKEYAELFNEVLEYALNNILVVKGDKRKERYTYWETLALLRGVMSSPMAGSLMLKNKAEKKQLPGDEDEFGSSEIPSDPELMDEEETPDDSLPTSLLQHTTTEKSSESRLLKNFAARFQKFSGIKHDSKAREAVAVLKDWIKQGRNPVVFCRFIQTAKYLHELCASNLSGKEFKDLNIEVITSEMDDEQRRVKIRAMNADASGRRLLIATDCLSEGINLQEGFDSMLHYDLPWNPNRLEQREGRIDRFGQPKPNVMTGRLYGSNNPVDGLVLDVLIRKSDEIRKTIGVSIPLPEDNKTVMKALVQAMLFKKNFKISDGTTQLALFDDEALKQMAVLHQTIEEAAEREKVSRSIFAHNSIKAEKVEADLKEVDDAIGDVPAVEHFVTEAVSFMGGNISKHKLGYKLDATNLPSRLTTWLPPKKELLISFASPTPAGYLYIGRNHPFTENICQLILNHALSRTGTHASRAAVMRTNSVKEKTVLIQFRVRNVIAEQPMNREIVAEEMWLWGYSGSLNDKKILSHNDARELLMEAIPTTNMTLPEQQNWFNTDSHWLHNDDQFRKVTDPYAIERATHLVDSHTRFRELVQSSKFKVVEPILPMDVLGFYVLVPETGM